MKEDMTAREFDVILWGASGFTGQLVAEYLAQRYGIGQSLKWAIAGRNASRLQSIRQSLQPASGSSRELPILLADSDDAASLRALSRRTRVVCSTVGPYAKLGSKLVAECVSAGTHYCDLSGEVHWMRQMIDAHHDAARQSGARIVHSCGFDCIPSDLGVHWLQREMRAQHGVFCRSISYRVESFKGGFSGGTAASMLHMMEQAEEDSSIAIILKDPYALNPVDAPRGLDGPEKTYPEYDIDFSAWVAPFMMAQVNTKVVRRSNALLGLPYGVEFRYDEGFIMPFRQLGFPLAVLMAGGSAMFTAATQASGLRALLSKALPQSGAGPDLKTREGGHFQIQLLGRHPSQASHNLRLRIRGDKDPGYGSTAGMLGESAVCLALDSLSSTGGVWTPAVAMGDALIDRIEENAGVSFETLVESEAD